MYVDPSGHMVDSAGSYNPWKKTVRASEGNIIEVGTGSSGGGGGGSTDQPGDIDEDVGNEEEGASLRSKTTPSKSFPRCSGPLCLETEHFSTVFFVPGDFPIPIIWSVISLDYSIGLEMEYLTDFEIQAIWYDIQIQENFYAWIGGDQEGAVITTMIIEMESGLVYDYQLGVTDVSSSYIDSKQHSPIQIPVTYGSYRDEISQINIRITTVIWGNIGVVLGSESTHIYQVPIVVGPNAHGGPK